MRVVRRGAAALASAFALIAATAMTCVTAGPAAAESTPLSVQALTPWDVQLYSAAFDAARGGRHDEAAEKIASVSDKSLAGYIEFQRLMSPSGPKASYDELSSWLDRYDDLPGAERVYALAQKRKPADALPPKAPYGGLGSQLWRKIETAARSLHVGPSFVGKRYTPTPESREAREAFYGGDILTARSLAAATGERWVAGLAAFRLGDYADALGRFEIVARDYNESAWMRSAGAYWAARSTIAAGSPERAPAYLQIAATTPYTFYGLLAERQLGLKSDITADDAEDDELREIAEATRGFQRVAALDTFALQRLMKTDIRAKRAVALSQLGLAQEAGQELRLGLIEAKTPEVKRQWTTLALNLSVPIYGNADTRRVKGVNPADFPTPRLTPRGGFTLDKALVYAIVRQESGFRQAAVSHAGARGLMQVMPATAAYVTGDSRLKQDVSLLTEPSTNLRVGQDYVRYLLDHSNGDLLRTVAAYNGGPGAVMKGATAAGTESDPLLLIEMLPAQETRDYVEKVMAGYWIYRRIFGEDSKTLDLVASGRQADLRQDR